MALAVVALEGVWDGEAVSALVSGTNLWSPSSPAPGLAPQLFALAVVTLVLGMACVAVMRVLRLSLHPRPPERYS